MPAEAACCSPIESIAPIPVYSVSVVTEITLVLVMLMLMRSLTCRVTRLVLTLIVRISRKVMLTSMLPINAQVGDRTAIVVVRRNDL